MGEIDDQLFSDPATETPFHREVLDVSVPLCHCDWVLLTWSRFIGPVFLSCSETVKRRHATSEAALIGQAFQFITVDDLPFIVHPSPSTPNDEMWTTFYSQDISRDRSKNINYHIIEALHSCGIMTLQIWFLCHPSSCSNACHIGSTYTWLEGTLL